MALLTPKQNPADLAMTNLTFPSKKRDRDCACTPELQRFGTQACLVILNSQLKIHNSKFSL
jgi:hypothetical protein